MTDRELLELAAKAAGIEVTAVVAEGIPHRFGGGSSRRAVGWGC